MERRLQMMMDSHDKLTADDAHRIIENINWYVAAGNSITAGMSEMADKIIALGFPIEKQDDGTFFGNEKILSGKITISME